MAEVLPTSRTATRIATRIGKLAIVSVPVVPPRPVSPLLPLILIAFSVALRLLYLGYYCPIELSPDEAHYWDWSRNLDWSYYSKGPLVAALIRASCECLGDTAFAVRLPAVLCHGLLLLAMRRLADDHFRDGRITLLVLALGLTLPPLSAAAVLMTTDPPFLACWAWAAVFCRQAIFDQRRRGWIYAGICCAVGMMAKYTMLMFPASIGLFLLFRPLQYRREFALFSAISLLGLAPILSWNLGHNGIGIFHLLGQTGAATGPKLGFTPLKPLEFLASQFGLFAGYWFVVTLVALWQYRPRNAEPRDSVRYLWWLSTPLLVVCMLATLRVKVQPNWPAAAYLTGFLLAVGWILEQMRSPSQRYRRWVLRLCVLGVTLGLTTTILAYYPAILRPMFAAIAGPARVEADGTVRDPAPIRKVDPTVRLRGWKHLAAAVDEVRERVAREDGEEALIATMVWNWPGELAFYCRSHPVVYSFGSVLGDRHSQYDLWRPNPVGDAQVFRGRTFLYVGEVIPKANDVFERMVGPFPVEYRENGVTIGVWQIWVGHGFKGFPEKTEILRY